MDKLRASPVISTHEDSDNKSQNDSSPDINELSSASTSPRSLLEEPKESKIAAWVKSFFSKSSKEESGGGLIVRKSQGDKLSPEEEDKFAQLQQNLNPEKSEKIDLSKAL